MIQSGSEKRSEFRFPVVVPVEYFKPDESSILSYSLDLSKNGTFISSDVPLITGSKFDVQLCVPINYESSKIFRTEGSVVWNKIQPFKSKRNGMGVKFSEPIPEPLLLNALAYKIKNLVKETEAKQALEKKIEKLETELEKTRRLAVLGHYTEKILFELANPILALSGKLEIIKSKFNKHKKMLKEKAVKDKDTCGTILADFESNIKEISEIIKDYKIISELANLVEDTKEDLEEKLQKRYVC